MPSRKRSKPRKPEPQTTQVVRTACPACGRFWGDLWRKPCPTCPTEETEPKCVVCHERVICCPFGMCRKCYDETPVAVRDTLPRRPRRPLPMPLIVKGRSTAEPPAPAGPTRARPGTAAKLAVMVERLRRGESLFHPRDVESVPVDLIVAFSEMCFEKQCGGVHWCKDSRRWRAYPWWTLGVWRYRRFHLGYFRKKENAATAVREWRELADRIGPKEAAQTIYRKWKARRAQDDEV